MHGNLSEDGLAFQTFGDLLQLRANQFPERLAFAYEDETGQTTEWTYTQLDKRARTIAAWLSEQAEVGDRALLVYPAGLEFIAAFFGCLYAGVLPVPATYPKPRRPSPRLDTIASDCSPKLALTHSSVIAGLSLDKQSTAVAQLTWEPTDKFEGSLAKGFAKRSFSDQDLAFLQYTSGSTSEPRGVMISHANLLHNVEMIRQGFGITPCEVQSERVESGVFWLPAYHDMGLIGGILTPIYVGGTSYLLAPTTFLKRPLRWLQLMSEKGAQISGAPNFGYELATQKISPEECATLDLSAWKTAFCGAEPINVETLRDFADKFAQAKFRYEAFYPCYGMAEATLFVTGKENASEPCVALVDREQLRRDRAVHVERNGDAEKYQSLVGCGAALGDQQVVVVAPKTSEVVGEEGCVGEIWVRGRSVARGYWNREEANREIFQAVLADEPDQHYLRTGDLGFCFNGELYVTGRLKDVIITRGQNHYPQDIERTVAESHEAIGLGAAFAVSEGRQEKLVVVHQINREHRKANFEAVLQAARTAIIQEHEIDPQAIVLIKPVSLPITSSGKVQRQRCRQQYLDGELQALAQWSAEACNGPAAEKVEVPLPDFLATVLEVSPKQLKADVESWLVRWLTVRADLKPDVMQPTTLFAELGIDSLSAVEISQDLEKALELMLPPMMIWSCPNCEELATFLSDELIADRKGERINVLPKKNPS